MMAAALGSDMACGVYGLPGVVMAHICFAWGLYIVRTPPATGKTVGCAISTACAVGYWPQALPVAAVSLWLIARTRPPTSPLDSPRETNLGEIAGATSATHASAGRRTGSSGQQ